MKEFTISSREGGQRLDKYLFKVLDRAPGSFVYKMLRKKNIVLNEKKASGKEILRSGDHVKLYLADDTFLKFASAVFQDNEKRLSKEKSDLSDAGRAIDLEIVYEGEDILVINKPAGLLSQKAKAGDDSANDRVIAYLLESGQLTREELRTFRPSVCNRLDRNTSGLLIAGKTMRGLQETAAQLRSRSVKKYYHALVWGTITEPEHLTAYLVKDHGTNQVNVYTAKPDSGGDQIETAYTPIASCGNATLLEIHLITGKSHQIRAHLASVGHPVLGDPKYGDPMRNRELFRAAGVKRQLLHACRLELSDGRVFESDDPKEFDKARQWLMKA
ncbi:MAG: RluA family pseudouridine synthase [Clostridiales bacterium]|nr:RluA family pseudouridine synthase [Clostridiales bacterium]